MLDNFYQGVNPYTGLPESEEERRKRLGLPALNDVVTSTEVKTYGDGTSEQITKQQIPAQAQAQPQPVTGPVDPETFQRMLQVESGNRQIDPRTGQIMTSPKGALGAGQVMPATAAQPGYGVTNIFDLAQQRNIPVPSRDVSGAQQLLGNEQLNREFAQNYANAMTQRFGQQGGVAAYNSGPGRVERNMQANAGQLNTQQLPQETQGYLDRVLGGVKRGAEAVANAVIPSAQAGELTPDQLRQQALAQRQQPPAQTNIARPSLATPGIQPDQTAPALGQGLRMPQTMLPPVTQPSTQAIDLYQQNQDNPEALLKMRGDANLPEFIRERASRRAYDLLDADIKKQQAQVQAQQLTTAAAGGDRRASLTVARELQNQEGSYLKMILLGMISPDLAREEAIKLGIGNKWTAAYDAQGNAGLIEVNAKGKPVRGTLADGSEMSKNDLIRYAAGGGQQLDIVGGTVVSDTLKDAAGNPLVGRVQTNKKTGQTWVQTDQGRMPMSGFRPQSSAGSLGDMYARRQQELLQKLAMVGPEKVAAIVAEDEAVNGPLDAITKQAILQRSTTAAPNMGAIPGAPAGQAQGGQVTAVPPTAMPPQGAATQAPPPPAAPTQGAAPTGGNIADRRRQAAAADTASKQEATVVGEDIGKARAAQGRVEQNADYLISKVDELITHPGFERSVGIKGPGLLFGLRDKPISGTREADWMSRFDEIGGRTFLEAFETLRGGGQITEKEGEKATQALNRMRTTTSEEEFKLAAKDFTEIVKRGVDRTRAKLKQEPKYGIGEESTQSRAENKPLSKEDQQAIEWARNNPNDPRAAEIKKRLGL